jgi:hypothetical protein
MLGLLRASTAENRSLLAASLLQEVIVWLYQGAGLLPPQKEGGWLFFDWTEI